MKTPEEKTGSLPLTDGEREAQSSPSLQCAEIVIDAAMVSLPITRYNELLRAEIERDIAIRAVVERESYELPKALALVFGLKEGDLPNA